MQARALKLSSMKSQFHLKATLVAYGSQRVNCILALNPLTAGAICMYIYAFALIQVLAEFES